MCPERFPSLTALLLVYVTLPAVRCQATVEPDESLLIRGSGGVDPGGPEAAPGAAASPAFGATVIIIVTVVVSGSAYLCLLRYVCGGWCETKRVVPNAVADPDRVEEQV